MHVQKMKLRIRIIPYGIIPCSVSAEREMLSREFSFVFSLGALDWEIRVKLFKIRIFGFPIEH